MGTRSEGLRSRKQLYNTFSANLGFLWRDLSLAEAIWAAKHAGFAAVECHWPYDTPAEVTKSVLQASGLPMLSLNTVPGDSGAGEFGLLALPGREQDAKAAIDQALTYASIVGAANVHVMAGNGQGEKARQTFIQNLQYATQQAAASGITVLIEPLNHYDAPDYFLKTSAQAVDIIETVAAENLKLMFDCYHLQIMEGDISRKLQQLMPYIGHIQIASVPDRAEPDHGELDYGYVFATLLELGYQRPLGAEYKPVNSTESGLGWLQNSL